MSEHTNTLSRRAFIGTAAAVGAVTMAAPNIAFGATAAEKQAEADAVRNQLVSLQADLETASENYYGALDEQQAAQDAMAAEQVKIDDTNAQIQELQGKLSTRARSMYRTGSASFLDFVLGASSFDEFTSNWDLLTQMNNNDSEMVDTSKQLREQLQASKDEYARQEQIAADKAAEAAQIQQEVQAKVDQATELVNSLDAEAKELLETGQVRTVADAVACVDISRSAFYKYKDFVSPFQDMSRGHLVTFNLELLDRQGVLSSVLAIFAENGANILTINQSIPTSGVAPVTITAATENMQTTMELFMAALKSAEGVIRVHIMAG